MPLPNSSRCQSLELYPTFGRKIILELTLIGAGANFFLSAYAIMAGNLILLFISRLLAGLFSGNSATDQTSIADVNTEKTKAKNFSLTGIVGSSAWIVGSPLGGFLWILTLVEIWIFQGYQNLG